MVSEYIQPDWSQAKGVVKMEEQKCRYCEYFSVGQSTTSQLIYLCAKKIDFATGNKWLTVPNGVCKEYKRS